MQHILMHAGYMWHCPSITIGLSQSQTSAVEKMWHQDLVGLELEVKNTYGSLRHKTKNLSLCPSATFCTWNWTYLLRTLKSKDSCGYEKVSMQLTIPWSSTQHPPIQTFKSHTVPFIPLASNQFASRTTCTEAPMHHSGPDKSKLGPPAKEWDVC